MAQNRYVTLPPALFLVFLVRLPNNPRFGRKLKPLVAPLQCVLRLCATHVFEYSEIRVAARRIRIPLRREVIESS